MSTQQRIVIFLAIIVTFLFMMKHQREMEEYQRQRTAWEAAETQRAAPEAETNPAPAGPAEAPAAFAPSPATPAPAAATPAASSAQAAVVTPAGTAETGTLAEETVVVAQPDFTAVFTSRGGALQSYALSGFDRLWETGEAEPLVLVDAVTPETKSLALETLGASKGWDEGSYRIVTRPGEGAARELVFERVADGWRVTKSYRFAPLEEPVDPALRYGFRLAIRIENLAAPRPLQWKLRALEGFLPDDRDPRSPVESLTATAAAKEDGGAIHREAAAKREAEPLVDPRPELAWVGLRGRFFTTVLRLEQPSLSGVATVRSLPLREAQGGPAAWIPYVTDHELGPFVKDNPHSARIEWESRERREEVREESVSFHFYGGPIREEDLAFDPSLQHLVSYAPWSLFEPISKVLAVVLRSLYAAIPNYGVAIILLTLIIKTLLHGLTRKQLRSSHDMQKLQPEIKKLREKYKSDQAKLQQETMRLWREHGVSPWGPCLPMFIQLPIFLALYGVFARVFDMRQALFIPGWITDLSQPDELARLPFTVPFAGWTTLNLLPILYVALQLYQMSMTPKSDDPQARQQQQMMRFMPFVFMFIFYSMPSGLVLYFTVSASYTLVEHWIIRRQIEGREETARIEAAGVKAEAGQGFRKKEKKTGNEKAGGGRGR